MVMLRSLLGSLKDKASMGRATLLSPSSPPDLLVLRATTHGASPSHPRHISALLSLGRCSRLTVAAATRALAARLAATRDPAVALKCLLAAHHVIQRGAFILQDQLLAALLPSPRGGRNPLLLPALPAHARWYARVLELVLASHSALGSFPDPAPDPEAVVALTNRQLLVQLDALVAIAEETGREPAARREDEGGLLGEVGRMVTEETAALTAEVAARMREVGERVAEMEFGELVEVGCMVRRMEACRPLDGDRRVRAEVEEVKERVEERTAVAAAGDRRLRRGERVGGSERVGSGSRVGVRFGSSRWSKSATSVQD